MEPTIHFQRASIGSTCISDRQPTVNRQRPSVPWWISPTHPAKLYAWMRHKMPAAKPRPQKICVVFVPLLGRIPYCINSPKLTAGTQKLMFWVNVSPFPKGSFSGSMFVFGGVLHLLKQLQFEFQFRKAASKRQSLRTGLSLQDFHDLIFVLELLARMTPC